MADYAPVASQYKPVQPMTLAEMMNLAGSAQAYKQAEQMNPLAVQRSASELSRLQQLTPEELRRAKAEAGRAETEAEVSEKTSTPRVTQATATAASAESTAERDRLNLLAQKQKQISSSQISMINNPLIIEAERNPNATHREALVNLVKQNGMTMARDLNIKPDEAIKLLQPYLDIAANDPSKLRQYFKERHIQGLDESARTSALSPSGLGVTTGIQSQVTSTNEFSAVPVGKPIPGTAVTMQLMPNEQLVTDTQGNNFIQSKDNQGRITIRPVTNAPAAPAVLPSAAPVVAPKPSAVSQRLSEQPAEAPANVPIHSQPVPPRFPVRQAGQAVFNLQQGEKEAQTSGGEYVRNVVAQRGAVAPVRNNLEKHNYSIINKSLSPAAPTEREQATGYLGFIILRFTDAMLMTMR
jgi:hypothetical protein